VTVHAFLGHCRRAGGNTTDDVRFNTRLMVDSWSSVAAWNNEHLVDQGYESALSRWER